MVMWVVQAYAAHHASIVDMILDAVMRSATYRMVGAAMRGHGLGGTLLIGVAIIVVTGLLKTVMDRRS
ncbi:hypothetical protein [Burkholderia vietnamiensis]|uniref:hypothetical protein n=1 Tax=Burkholderia vietnamiensis TaxID=60552 RepID=UPI00069C6B93|nr:hypothetical protein [Burkholderia vietnamiensis]